MIVKVSVFEGAELGPPVAAWVAVTEWLALVSGVVGVKLQLPLATVVEPAHGPINRDRHGSPADPRPRDGGIGSRGDSAASGPEP